MAEKSSVWHKIVSLFKTRSQFVLISRYREQVAEANKRDYFLLLLTALVLNSAILVSRIWIPGRDHSVAKRILSGSQLGLTLLILLSRTRFQQSIIFGSGIFLWLSISSRRFSPALTIFLRTERVSLSYWFRSSIRFS